MADRLLIVDFGSQVTQLIARRLREAGVYCEIHPFQQVDQAHLKQFDPKAIVLSGGPASVIEGEAPSANPAIFAAKVPVLGICYGEQTMAQQLGGASTRIDVLNLLADLKERGLAVLFITHDLSLGNYLSDQTVILRKGAIVERGATEKVFGDPRHPYTRTLLASVPRLGVRWDDLPVPETEGHECDAPLDEVDEEHFVACFDTAGAGHGRKSESV